MTRKIIAVDAMGGDFGPSVTVPGALKFLQRYEDAELILVGDEPVIRNILDAEKIKESRLSIRHATQVVGMDEPPQSALKNKKDSSMRVAVNLVKEKAAGAAVSAGNTGAWMATARFVLKTIPGTDRPAIAKFLPAAKGHLTLMLDLGANVDCSSEQLFQFAVMGSSLVAAMHPEVGEPRVGLLNVGTEDIKGNSIIKDAHRLLSSGNLNFVGNVEGNAVFSGEVDVVVSDGFTGNVVLKTIEGAVGFFASTIKEEFHRSFINKMIALLAMPTLKGFKKRLDPRRFNGAIFLGLRGVVIKSHGGTDAEGFSFALQEAYSGLVSGVQNRIESDVTRILQAASAAGNPPVAADEPV